MAKKQETSHRDGQDDQQEEAVAVRSNGHEEAEGEALPDPSADFPIVGIGASAGGLAAFEQFFKNLPEAPGMAFVLVQHLAPDHKSELASLLQNHTRLEVRQVEDNTEVRADHVYVIPPGKSLSIEEGVLHLSEPLKARGHRAPIDLFFRSLAEDQGERAVCIILSGTGSDGTLGLKAIKAAGGVTMAQAVEDAEYDGMPKSAIHTRLVDVVAPAAELANRLVAYRKSASAIQIPEEDALPEDGNDALLRIFAQLQDKTGHDFTHYKRSTILRRIGRRLHVNRIESIPQYLAFLRENPSETQALFKDFLISVTNFFRDPAAFAYLEERVIPALFAHKGGADTVRVWVPGCATGEEAYSIGMMLCDHASAMENPPALQLFATDIDEEAIAFAREALYSDAIAADVSPERLRRFFAEEAGGYRVKKDVREIVLFASHDILQDPPFSRLDLVSCRNLLIYLNREVQEKVFDLFHYALRPGGFLMLGNSESVEAGSGLFDVEKKAQRLFRRRDYVAAPPRFPAVPLLPPSKLPLEGERPRPGHTPSLEDLYQAYSLRRHTPPRLLVNDNYDITHVFGEAGRYLHDREGPTTQNVLQRIHSALRLDLRAALYEAFHKGERIESRRLRVEVEGVTHGVKLIVGPIAERSFPRDHVEVVFAEAPQPLLPLSDPRLLADDGEETRLVGRIEEELLRTREHLQTSIEEYETSNEELKASNEELQSMNEELQSAAEELETSKEELQSMNEELITVNQELKTKIGELSRANSDLQNLMASTEVATLFLDRELRVQRFTPRAHDLFNILPADLGRPFAHVSHKINYDGLPDDAARVLESLVHVEHEVEGKDRRWYVVRIFPYRTVEDKIDGVVLTFLEVTALKAAEREAAARAHQQQVVANLGRLALEGTPLDDLFDIATKRVCTTLEVDFSKVLELLPDGESLLLRAGQGWHDGLVGRATVPSERGSQAGYTLATDGPVIVRSMEEETRFSGPDLLLNHGVVSGLSVIIRGFNGPYGVFGAHTRQPRAFSEDDISFISAIANLLADAVERKRYEEKIHLDRERFETALKHSPITVFSQDHNLVYTWIYNPSEGLADEIVGRTDHDLFEADDAARLEAFKREVMETGTGARREMTARIADEIRYFDTTVEPLRDAEGRVVGVTSAAADITARKRNEQALAQSERTLHLALEAGKIGVWSRNLRTNEMFFDERARQLFGMEEAMTAARALQRIHPDDAGLVEAAIARALDPAGDGLYRVEHRLQLPDDETRWLDVRGQCLFDGDGPERLPLLLTGVAQDVTERRQAEMALRELNETLEERVVERTEQVRELATALTLSEQRERHRIAQILHDHLQQLLYGLQLKMQLLRLDPDSQASLLDEMDDVIRQAITSARTLTVDLSPPVLQDEGLREALLWLAHQMVELHGLQVHLHTEGRTPDLPEEMRVLLFQLVRELLFNVVKHANVEQADVRLRQADETLFIEVDDAGEGFVPEKVKVGADRQSGFGLLSIRDRLGLFGGALVIDSAPGRGTTVTIQAPLRPTNPAQTD